MKIVDKHRVWHAPAKLNLFLHITGQRDDGYHLLQTVFQFLDYGDVLQFAVREDGEIIRDTDLPGVSEDEDLVVCAANLLQQEIETPLGVNIRVDKRLPMGGGLGGGSSDAATTLVALNQIWDCGLSREQLSVLGLTLGADVPVFIQGHAAWAEGVGEQLNSINPVEPWFVVLNPAINVSTKAIFLHRSLNRSCSPITIRDFQENSAQLENVCESVVRDLYPEVDEALSDLAQFGIARMTGTGACIFAAFATAKLANDVFRVLEPKWSGFVARGCNISPLYKPA
jgi:4-diphosphocytidyl-2-C-methyl-D-erythritol kinase